MRYVTQFQLSFPENETYLDERIKHQQKINAAQMAGLLVETIGFEQEEDPSKYRMEIQAFAQKDWVSFKKQLKEYIETTEKTGLSTFNLIMVGKMLKELESIGHEKAEKTTNG